MTSSLLRNLPAGRTIPSVVGRSMIFGHTSRAVTAARRYRRPQRCSVSRSRRSEHGSSPGLLTTVPDAKPVRVEILALAETRRALDLIREHADDRRLLAHVMRILKDRAALEGSEEGFADHRAGRVVPLGDDLRHEIADLRRREKKSRSKSR